VGGLNGTERLFTKMMDSWGDEREKEETFKVQGVGEGGK